MTICAPPAGPVTAGFRLTNTRISTPSSMRWSACSYRPRGTFAPSVIRTRPFTGFAAPTSAIFNGSARIIPPRGRSSCRATIAPRRRSLMPHSNSLLPRAWPRAGIWKRQNTARSRSKSTPAQRTARKPSSWSIPSNGWWVARPFSRSTQSAWPRMKENPFPSVILPCSTGRKPRPTCSPRPWPVRECRTSAVRTGVFPSSRSCRRYSRRCPSRLVAGTVPLGGTTLRVVNCVAERRTTRLVSPRTSSAAKMGRSPPAARLAPQTSIRCSIG